MSLFNFYRIDKNKTKEEIQEIKEPYKYYHYRYWCFQKAYKYFQKLNFAIHHVQKSRPSNFERLTFRLFRNGFNRWFLLIPGLFMFRKFDWSKILPQPKMAKKMQRNKLSNKRC